MCLIRATAWAFLFLSISCGQDEIQRLRIENTNLDRLVSEAESRAKLAELDIQHTRETLKQEQKAREAERDLFISQASNHSVRIQDLTVTLDAVQKKLGETEQKRASLQEAYEDMQQELALLQDKDESSSETWDSIRLKNGKSAVGKVLWMDAAQIAVELPSGQLTTGPVSLVEMLRFREPGLTPSPPAKPPESPAPPDSEITPEAPTLAEVAPADTQTPAPKIELTVIRHRNQKIGEAGRKILLQIQAPQLMIAVKNLNATLPLENLHSRIWILARGVQDTSEYQLIYSTREPFSLPAGGTWNFQTEPRKITARQADKMAQRSGWELYGYLVQIERDGDILEQKASVARLLKIVDVLEKKKEGAVFRL